MDANAITTYLASLHLAPTVAFTTELLPTLRPSTPLPALQKTALFRLLASDIRHSLDPAKAASLPPNTADPTTKSRVLTGTIPVQVLEIHDIGTSAWSQVIDLEALERGEGTRGREVVRLVPEEGEEGAGTKSKGPWKLLIQDVKGQKVYAFELEGVDGIGAAMSVGCKILLRGAAVDRGVVMLQRGTCEVLGGKIEAWDRAWKGGKKDRLRGELGVADRPD